MMNRSAVESAVASVPNPHSRVDFIESDDGLEHILVLSPVRGAGLQLLDLTPETQPELFAFFEQMSRGEALESELTQESWVTLEQSGFLVPAQDVPQEALYAGSDLLPGRFSKEISETARLLVHPSLQVLAEGHQPTEFALDGEEAAALLPRGPLAWIVDPGPDLAVPWEVDEADLPLLESLRPGEVAPPDLPSAFRRRWQQRGALLSAAQQRRRTESFANQIQTARASFEINGYAIFRDLIGPQGLSALRMYFRRLVAEGHLPLGDAQVSGRYWAHDDPVGRMLAAALLPAVRATVGLNVQPTYSYFACYQPGAWLSKHTDRKECAFSISLQLDADPELEPWPLQMDVQRPEVRTESADLRLGDALFYMGQEIPHYRDTLPAGRTSSSIFLHYVEEG